MLTMDSAVVVAEVLQLFLAATLHDACISAQKETYVVSVLESRSIIKSASPSRVFGHVFKTVSSLSNRVEPRNLFSRNIPRGFSGRFCLDSVQKKRIDNTHASSSPLSHEYCAHGLRPVCHDSIILLCATQDIAQSMLKKTLYFRYHLLVSESA